MRERQDSDSRSSDSTSGSIHLSVVIRVRNEANCLLQVLQALKAQRFAGNWEVLIVDNESTDDSRANATEYGARVVGISQAEFSYGRAINLGVEQARGEIIVLLSAHALPLGSHFLQSCAEALSDENVAAAKCFDVHHWPVREWYAPRDLEYSSEDEKQNAIKDPQWWSLYPIASCSVIRKSVWKEIPFDEALECSEDKLWASEVLKRGYRIRHCSEAMWLRLRRPRGRYRLSRLSREVSSTYRITGNRPLTWKRWCIKVALSVVKAPVVALRYMLNEMITNTVLVLSSRGKGRGNGESGSFREFDTHY